MDVTKPKDYYGILGISSSASKEEIKAAYRKLIKIWHPDACKESGADVKTKALNEAYAILSDDLARAEYHNNLRIYAEWQRNRAYEESDSRSRETSRTTSGAKTFRDQERSRSSYGGSTYGSSTSDGRGRTFRDAEQARARKQAERYNSMSLADLLSDAVDTLLHGSKEGRGNLNFIDYNLLGLKVWICVGLFALCFTLVLIPLSAVLGRLIAKGLYHNGRFVGFMALIKGALLLFVEAALILFILILLTERGIL